MVSKKEKIQPEEDNDEHSSPFFVSKNNLSTAILSKITAVSSDDSPSTPTSILEILKIKRRIIVKAITADKIEEMSADKMIKAVEQLTSAIILLEKEQKSNPTPESPLANKRINENERKRIKETVNRVLS